MHAIASYHTVSNSLSLVCEQCRITVQQEGYSLAIAILGHIQVLC